MTRFLIYFAVIVFAVHEKQYTQIKHFLSLEQAKQQQNCL